MVSAFRRTRGERTAHDMPRCRGLLSDGAASPCRRQRPPPHAGVDDAAVDSSSAAKIN